MCNYVSYYIPAAAVISAFSPGVLKKVYDEDSVAVDFLGRDDLTPIMFQT
jgi:hypothetical protein